MADTHRDTHHIHKQALGYNEFIVWYTSDNFLQQAAITCHRSIQLSDKQLQRCVDIKCPFTSPIHAYLHVYVLL